jgi:hypothetical protein
LFQDEVLQHRALLMAKLEAYMAPLSKMFNLWSHNRAAIVESILLLLSYIRPLEGVFNGIQPELGSVFDPEFQEGFDEEEQPLLRGKGSNQTVEWVLRRGFRYREDSLDGPREMVVKAVVIVE